MPSPTFDRRRDFLRFAAASPLAMRAWAQQGPIAAAKDAINVMDFEEAARKALPPAHWGYLTTGVDDDLTLKANREGYQHIQLRPRRLAGVTQPDLKIELFGSTWESPLFLCPVGMQKAFHAEGEVAVARAAKAKRHVQILSTVTTCSVEDVAQALGAPPWFQLYLPTTWDATEKLLRRVEAASCPALVWTIDLLGGRNTETLERFRRLDRRDCTTCHETARGGAGGGAIVRRPMFDGTGATGYNPAAATWQYLERLRKMTRMKLLLKGIETREDAVLAREHGVDGIVVSNHGGRAAEDLRPTIESLPEVIDGAGSQIPVLLDGGIRRGSDIFKALALGARAVGIGRPYVWGLSAFGQEGVERVLDILLAELRLVMRQCGTPSVKQIQRAAVAVKA